MTCIKFRFNLERMIQAIAQIVRHESIPNDTEWVLGTLYLADRKSLIEKGHPITGATYEATSRGPVPVEIRGLDWKPSCFGYRDIGNGESRIVVKQDPGDDLLSDYDVQTIQDIVKHYRAFSPTSEALTETIRELGDAYGCLPGESHLSPEAILRFNGWENKEIEALAQKEAYFRAFEDLFQKKPLGLTMPVIFGLFPQ